jgi:hypothetical protein
MRTTLFLCVLTLIITSCNHEPTYTAQEIIDKTIKASGGELYENAQVTFNFRDKVYKSTRQCNRFMLERFATDSTGQIIHDMLDNDGLMRLKDGKPETVHDTLKAKISDGINSVHYFAHLPYGLNDASVNKELLNETNIKNIDYHKVKVWFNQEGGGTDYQDVYMYWINKKNFEIDYLAYTYEVNGGGIRFREAYNKRIINGIRFADYNNYKPKTENYSITTIDSLFNNNQLQLLSKIETEEVTVKILDKDCS